MQVNNETVKLEIWDTAGQERFRCITQSFYKGCMGIIIAFDLTNHESFNNVTSWLTNLRQEADDNVIKVLVGNKADLTRNVSKEEVDNLVAKNNLPYFETSAKTGQNIDEIFIYLAREVYKKFLAAIKDSILTDPTVNVSPNLNPNPDGRISLANKNQTPTTTKKQNCC